MAMGEITRYARILISELEKKGIKVIPEYYDGHKSVDLFIPIANLIVEVDGQHHDKEKQALTDLKRATYSLENGCFTYHLPNALVYNYPSETADLIAAMVKSLKNKKVDNKTIDTTVIPEKPKKVIEQKLEVKISKNPPLPKNKIEIPIRTPIKVKHYADYSQRKMPANKVLNEIKTLPMSDKTISFLPQKPQAYWKFITLAVILLGAIAFIIINLDKKDDISEEHLNNISYPQVEPIILAGSKTDVIITNNKNKDVSLNVTYRIYSSYFGIDAMGNRIFEVKANSKQNFLVYDNVGCSHAPCAIEILDFSEVR